MCAEMTGDITPLVSKAYVGYEGEGLSHKPKILKVLRQLIILAPNTEPTARLRVEKDWEFYLAINKSFANIPDEAFLWGEE
jgi:hypothetical protein